MTMGYFSNSTEGEMYAEQYCDHCVHQNGADGQSPCMVWSAHLLLNYDECNNKDSILHMLIPRSEGGFNDQCRMFWRKSEAA